MLPDETREEIRRHVDELIAHHRRKIAVPGGSIEDYQLDLLAVAEEVRKAATLEADAAGRDLFRRKVPGEVVGEAAGCSRQNAERKWKRKAAPATPVAVVEGELEPVEAG